MISTQVYAFSNAANKKEGDKASPSKPALRQNRYASPHLHSPFVASVLKARRQTSSTLDEGRSSRDSNQTGALSFSEEANEASITPQLSSAKARKQASSPPSDRRAQPAKKASKPSNSTVSLRNLPRRYLCTSEPALRQRAAARATTEERGFSRSRCTTSQANGEAPSPKYPPK